MQPGNPTGKTHGASVIAAKTVQSRPPGEGFVEITVLSLAGLVLSLMMIAQGMFPDASWLRLGQ
jgi:hypothetical protein